MHVSDFARERSAARRAKRIERRDEKIFLVVETIVAASLRLPVARLHANSRCPAPVAFARQVAMYIAHVGLKQPVRDIARYFGRDRTTVTHACEVIEDRREDPDIDRLLTSIESTIDVWVDYQRWLGSAQ